MTLALRTFDPSEPRDEGGKWTGGGGDGGDGEAASSAGSSRDVTPDKYQSERLIKDGSMEGFSKSGIVKDANLYIWGASHSGSTTITGHSATRMGIKGYKDGGDASKQAKNLGDKFLRVIASSEGAHEPLYHGFSNAAGVKWKAGDTLSLPLLASSGDKSDAVGYGTRSGQPPEAATVFEFQAGTPYAGYARWDREQSKDFGHQWSEAIVAGKFEVTGTRHEKDVFDGEYDVVSLKPLAVFDPELDKWHNR